MEGAYDFFFGLVDLSTFPKLFDFVGVEFSRLPFRLLRHFRFLLSFFSLCSCAVSAAFFLLATCAVDFVFSDIFIMVSFCNFVPSVDFGHSRIGFRSFGWQIQASPGPVSFAVTVIGVAWNRSIGKFVSAFCRFSRSCCSSSKPLSSSLSCSLNFCSFILGPAIGFLLDPDVGSCGRLILV